MNNRLSSFPDERQLLERYPEMKMLHVNSHLHTPFSFSAFDDIPQIFRLAREEGIDVVGINDFFVTDGYGPFNQEARKTGIFPLFNIEFIALMKAEQQQHIRVNDPNNPGRCYLCGKGLDYPFSLDEQLRKKLNGVIGESQQQVRSMIDRANDWFSGIGAGISLNYDAIRRNLARNLVRERHVAKAIRMAVYERYPDDPERVALLTAIFDGRSPKSPPNDLPSLENEIRGNLLKAGGKAFVEEDDNAFMSLEEAVEIIFGAGGFPCYPVLLDDKNGNYTEFEKDPEFLWKQLIRLNIGCIELIPGRNDAGHLQRFTAYFRNKGFVILMGTEHNTPEMISLRCDTRGKIPLSPDMQQISYEGACVVAAHQYLRAKGQTGFESRVGRVGTGTTESYRKLGNAVIHHYLHQFRK